MARSRVYVDTRAGAFSEAGDLLLAVAEGAYELGRVAGELGEVLLETAPGRTGPDQVTIYKSVGIAAEDAAAAALVLRRARERGVGRSVGL